MVIEFAKLYGDFLHYCLYGTFEDGANLGMLYVRMPWPSLLVPLLLLSVLFHTSIFVRRCAFRYSFGDQEAFYLRGYASAERFLQKPFASAVSVAVYFLFECTGICGTALIEHRVA
eukprot:6203775-Pleurochrysis_carterae.AAC.1